jgi:hypothetical protein
MNDTTRLLLTVALATVLVALVVYDLGTLGDDALSLNDAVIR